MNVDVHNQIRKVIALKHAIRGLEALKFRHQPAFDEDKALLEILEKMHTEHDAVAHELSKLDKDTFDKAFKEVD